MDELARLISSLSKSEKRYFKMFSGMQAGEKGYLKLFDAVEKLGDYDDEAIRQMFEGEDFIKRLPAVKNYLYSQILRSLRILHSGETVDSQIKEMIEEVSVLYEKRLYRQCMKVLDRAEDIASKNELVVQQIEINMWREKVAFESLSPDVLEKKLADISEKETHLLSLQKNNLQFRNLHNQILILNKKLKEARTDDELARFHDIISHPLMQSVYNALSFDARHNYYQAHLIYHHAKGDNEKCLETAEELLKLLESYPDKIKERPKMYISALHNVLLSKIQLHNYENFQDTLGKLKLVPVKSISAEVNRFVSASIFEMVSYLDPGRFTDSIPVREFILDGMNKYADKINAIEEITLLYNLFYSYFGTGEYTKALGMINKLLNEYQKELRYDVQSAVRILNLILHYELKNTMLLEYNAVSTYRFLYKSKRLYKLESIILNFIKKKMPEIFSPRDEHEAFIELRKEFVAIADDPYEKKAFEYFDYIAWLDSKIEKKSFEQIVQEKFEARSRQRLAAGSSS
jgi:hypothetical protein